MPWVAVFIIFLYLWLGLNMKTWVQMFLRNYRRYKWSSFSLHIPCEMWKYLQKKLWLYIWVTIYCTYPVTFFLLKNDLLHMCWMCAFKAAASLATLPIICNCLHRVDTWAHSKYRTISSITKDVQKVYYNLRTKGEFVQELYNNREFQIMYSSSILLFVLL